MQNHSLGILTRFGMYAVENNNIGTCTSYPSLVQRLGFTLFMTQFRRLLIAGFSFFAQGFSPLRKWTFGAGYNHQACCSSAIFFFNFDHFTLLLLLNVSWVGTHNKTS